ncbi:hypothetical protein H7D82_000778 [Salmonella enterica]|nr:hypothetical protein [Salmonella enterica]EKB7612251.1 hypothetical protein [Salmonella enterica]
MPLAFWGNKHYYFIAVFISVLWLQMSWADTDFSCVPEKPEIKGPVSTNVVTRRLNIGPYTNELNFESSTIPGGVDLSILKGAIQRAFTSGAWVDFKNGVSFSAIDYTPFNYIFKTGTYGTGYVLSVSNNQAQIVFPAGTGSLSVDTWVTMQPQPFRVTLPAVLNGPFTVRATGLLGYFFVYGSTVDKRHDAAVLYNCTAISQPTLSVSPTVIDFGTMTVLSGTPAVERMLTVTVPQAGVSGQVGIELISPAIIDRTKVSLGLSWFEVINPSDGTPVPVSATEGQGGVLLTKDETNLIVRLHPVVGSHGNASVSLIVNVIWM